MRVLLFLLFAFCGAAAIFTGLLVPAHLRAVDPYVLRGMNPGRSLSEAAVELASEQPAVAKLFVLAAEQLNLPVEDALDALRETRVRPTNVLTRLERQQAGLAVVQEVPVLTALRPAAARQELTNSLQSGEARQILGNLAITNTTLFAPVASAAGFPLEAAILTTACMVEMRAMPVSLREEIVQLTARGATGAIEEFYINMLSLARRYSSAQMMGLLAHLPSISSLDIITRALQVHADATAILYSATVLSGRGAGLAEYIISFPETALDDISFALARGERPLNHLIDHGQPLFRSVVYDEFATDRRLQGLFQPLLRLAIRVPSGALVLKFALFVIGAASLVVSTRFAGRPQPTSYVLYPAFSLVRRAAAAVVLLILVIILGEPYLARGTGEETPLPVIRFSFAAITTPAAATSQPSSSSMIDGHTILAITTFLVLQGLIYAICLVKLAEIRKQPVPNATKLKLLDNEENLFDGGLYCGLFGTAASLILLTLGVIKPSLISAYSSTLFGILSVALVKIVHVRPYKRRLLLETTEGA